MSNRNDVLIRPLEPDDASDIYEIMIHPKTAVFATQLTSMEFAELEKWMQKEDGNLHRLVAVRDGRILGRIQLTHLANPRMRHSGSLDLLVHPDYWHMGIGTALVETALNIADNWLDLARVQLEVLTENKDAIRLYEQFGFVEEGLRKKAIFGNGRFQDDLVMSRLRNEFIYDHKNSTPSYRRPTDPRPTGEVTLRPIRKEDAKSLYELFTYPEVCRTTLQLPSQESWRSAQRVDSPYPGMVRYMAVVDGKPVGSASVYRHQNQRKQHAAGLGMMVHPNYWGMGIGSKLMAQLLEIADNWLNLQRVELEVNIDNPPAVALYRKFGFEIEGTHKLHAYGDGRMADSYFMARIK